MPEPSPEPRRSLAGSLPESSRNSAGNLPESRRNLAGSLPELCPNFAGRDLLVPGFILSPQVLNVMLVSFSSFCEWGGYYGEGSFNPQKAYVYLTFVYNVSQIVSAYQARFSVSALWTLVLCCFRQVCLVLAVVPRV